MAGDPRVLGLLKEMIDAGRTPDEVCRGCPELLDEVRKQWTEISRIDATDVEVLPSHRTALYLGALTPVPTVADLPQVPGYDLLGEVGRGGMGIVYRARDLSLDRDVAVKLLQDCYPADSPVARRFTDEAKITAQLQHPGVPAVYRVGTLPDGRPYLVIKLIMGRTLAALLEERSDPTSDRGRFVAVFEGVCQAVAYAHSLQVIHRDLKPSNVMVGKFGEIQVMDWGLAKVLPVGRSGGESPQAATDGTVIRTRSAGTADTLGEFGGPTPETRTGTVLGTPAYMAPEQAGGEVGRLDTRADVFGLGSVLCEVLTGKPPYIGREEDQVHRKAMAANQADAHARLTGCGAEPELVALCRRCLAAEPDERPRDAGEVACAVAALRAAAEDRARRAELDRVLSAEKGKRRRVLLAAIGAVAVVLLAGLSASLWQTRRAMQAEAVANANADQAGLNAEEAERNARQARAERDAKDVALAAEQRARRDEAKARRQAFDALPLLGKSLFATGDVARAMDAFRKAAELNPIGEGAKDLTAILIPRGGLEEARVAWEKILERHPPTYDSWYGYAQLCLFLGNEGAYRRARKALLDRFGKTNDWIVAERSSLACLLMPASGDELRRSVELADKAVTAAEKSSEPGNPYVRFVKGLAEYRQGRPEQAIPWLEQSASGLPNRPGPRLVLAMAQFQSGSAMEARRTLAAAVQVYPWNESPPASQMDLPVTWVSHVLRREAEAMILPNLPAFLEGKYQPQDNDERIALLGICQFQSRYATVARLYADAFGTDPHLADDLNKKCLHRTRGREAAADRIEVFDSACRYLAARCAVLAGCGLGKDGEKLSEEERTRWRQQARDWLQADLAAWAMMLESNFRETRDLAKRMLEHWQVDPDLAGLRDPDALERLPPAERQKCRMLWQDVDAVRNRNALPAHAAGVNEEGFVQRWLVLAPIPLAENQSGADALDKEQVKDEAKLRVKAGDTVKVGDKTLVWKEYTCKEYALDFNVLLGAQTEDSVAYALSYFFVPVELKGVKMKTGSDDQAKVYLNGKQVFKHAGRRALKKDEDTTEVILQTGLNVVVVKVVNEKVDWAFCVRFMDKDDKPLTNLKAQTKQDQ
jgi:serine/threonine protein kinase